MKDFTTPLTQNRGNTVILSHCKDIESPCPLLSRKSAHYQRDAENSRANDDLTLTALAIRDTLISIPSALSFLRIPVSFR